MSHERRFDPKSLHKLEAPDRQLAFPVAAILDAAEIRGAMTVADIGAGSGYFALPVAQRVAPGRVYAVDPSPELLEVLRSKLAANAVANVELVSGEAESTALPDAGCDLVFLSAVWHEIDRHDQALKEFARIAKPKAKLVIVDWRPEAAPPPGPPFEHRIPRGAVEKTLAESGWRVVHSSDVTEWTYLVVGERHR